jgi:3-deoxy-manno-octulosonate cytidylyltransferase (CMP-KDO synthetase)
MVFTVIIPARFGSTRLPGKPLLDIAGRPMVQRVWEQARLCGADRVVIATDDVRIRDVAKSFGADVCMTAVDHPSGTDRLQEVVTQLNLPPEHIVVNVQGDEPLIPPQVIDQVARNLDRHIQADMATLCEGIDTLEALVNPNVVKVVRDAQGMALYFSRAPIPWPREAFMMERTVFPPAGEWHRHIGIYAYRTQFLHQYVAWPSAPQEQLESLEQLRALHNGIKVHVDTSCQQVPAGVDTESDLNAVRQLLAASG